MAFPETYLIVDVNVADLTNLQLYGRACVYCRGTEALAHAGWLHVPLAPRRHLSTSVSSCGRCREARARPPDTTAAGEHELLPPPPSVITELPSVDGPVHP